MSPVFYNHNVFRCGVYLAVYLLNEVTVDFSIDEFGVSNVAINIFRVLVGTFTMVMAVRWIMLAVAMSVAVGVISVWH